LSEPNHPIYILQYIRFFNDYEQETEIAGVFDSEEQAKISIPFESLVWKWVTGGELAVDPFNNRWFITMLYNNVFAKPQYLQTEDE